MALAPAAQPILLHAVVVDDAVGAVVEPAAAAVAAVGVVDEPAGAAAVAGQPQPVLPVRLLGDWPPPLPAQSWPFLLLFGVPELAHSTLDYA